MARAILILATLSTAVASAQAATATHRINGVTLGCLAPADTETWVKIDVIAEDRDAKKLFFNDKVEGLKNCRVLTQLDAVESDHRQRHNDRWYECVRPAGDYRCWYVFEGYYRGPTAVSR